MMQQFQTTNLDRPLFIEGAWVWPSDRKMFQAVNPSTGELLPHRYPISDSTDIDRALTAGLSAANELIKSPDKIPRFLEAFASEIESLETELLAASSLESGLPASPRLVGELQRTVDQIQQAAWAAKDGSWRQATIDTSSGVRSILAPLGKPVAVFGPNNFPFAFNSVSGGDAVAALAAGNPVIGKGNPAHPRTTELLAEAARRATYTVGAPAAIVQLVYKLDREEGLAFVSDRRVGAVGFTGSKGAGLTLKRAADNAGVTFYAEMGSLNPVLIMQDALTERLDSVLRALTGSCLVGMGQFCTKPGLVAIPVSEEGDRLVECLAMAFNERGNEPLLSEPTHLALGVSEMLDLGARLVTGGHRLAENGYRFANTILTVDADEYLRRPHDFDRELFGPVTTLLRYRGTDELVNIVRLLDGSLTGSIYSSDLDSPDYYRVAFELRRRVGRLLNDKMPTGVVVVPSMNHGGPYPATGHPGFTSVGIPASITRFAALHSYDNVRQARLPVEIRDPNPTGTMWRYIDREWTLTDIL